VARVRHDGPGAEEDILFFSRHRELFLNALRSVRRNPVRSLVIVLALVGLLTPFVTAIAICEGIKGEYASLVKEGANVYVARDHYGSNAPIELDMKTQLEEIQGITRVVPRVIGRTYVKGMFLAILGIQPGALPPSLRIAQGRAPGKPGEVILGQDAAAYLKLGIGSRFSLNRNPAQQFEIVGLFCSPCRVWNVDLLVMGFEDASLLFGLEGRATDLSVYTRPGYEQIVEVFVRLSEKEEEGGKPPLRVQTRDLIHRYAQRGFNIKAGVFSGLYCLVLALGIPAIGIISGFGLSERRRDIGVMKALGWQTQEVLETVAMENLILSMVSLPFIALAAAVWIYPLNGAFIARFFVASLDILIPFPVPSRLFPIPCLLGIMMTMILTMVGSVYSTWKTAVVPPSEAMRT
jgi:ABC-type lipoprotein release transport system permease subunit